MLSPLIGLLALVVAAMPASAMNNPGPFSLGDFPITTAGTLTGTPQTGLSGIEAASLQVRLSYGSGGSTIRVYVQTSLDQGASWIDVAAVLFTNNGAVQIVNLSALDKLTTWTTPTDGALTDNTVLDGPVGDQFRVKIISTGTYSGGTLVSVRGVAR
jgi:hypothetical protein